MLERMREEVPRFDLVAHPELAEPLRRSCQANVAAALEALARDRQPPTAAPLEALEEARMTAQAGLGVDALLATYRIGQQVCLEAFIDELEALRPEPEARRDALKLGTRATFDYLEAVMSIVVAEHARTRDRQLRSSAQRRLQLTRDLLDGAEVEAGALGYDPRATHTAVVVDGPRGEAIVRALAGDRRLLVVTPGERTTWAWIAEPVVGATGRRAADRTGPGVQIGVSEPHPGTDGFRAAHREALLAARVATRLGRQLALHADVALEAQALHDPAAARRFVREQLGPLLTDDARTTALRETLDAYLASAHNASAAGARLGVSDRTVAYRIARVAELLGHDPARRATELAVALRWLPLVT